MPDARTLVPLSHETRDCKPTNVVGSVLISNLELFRNVLYRKLWLLMQQIKYLQSPMVGVTFYDAFYIAVTASCHTRILLYSSVLQNTSIVENTKIKS